MYKEIYIDRLNYNSLVVITNGGKSTYIAIPPGRNRVDLISFKEIDSKFFCHYEYKLDGIIIVTDSYTRYLIDSKGYIIDKVYLNEKNISSS